MNDAKLEKHKAKLVEAKLMDEQDTLIDFLQARCGTLNWQNGQMETRMGIFYRRTLDYCDRTIKC